MARRTRPSPSRRSLRRLSAGAPPGLLQVDGDAPEPQLSVVAYGPERLVELEGVASLERVTELRESHPVVWVQVSGAPHEATLRRLGELFELHPLALEDVANGKQRPKLEDYAGQVFLTAALPSSSPEGVTSEQLSVFFGAGWVLSFCERSPGWLLPLRRRISQRGGRIRGAGADYLVYALLDSLVDHLLAMMEGVEDRLDELEDEVFASRSAGVVNRLMAQRHEVLHLRRAIWPLRDVLNGLQRDADRLLQPETRIYLRDAYDHLLRTIELLEGYREHCSGLMDVHLSVASQRMNEVMKVLTIMATVFIPLSFVAGLYGMNFDGQVSAWNMPELRWAFGYPFALGLMSAIAGGMLFYFWRRGWLSSRD